MNSEEEKLIERFVKNARPADRVPYILQQEIVNLLTEIRDELKGKKSATTRKTTKTGE